jgi:hypothetical protein
MHAGRRLPVRSCLLGILHGMYFYPMLARMHLVNMIACFLAFL